MPVLHPEIEGFSITAGDSSGINEAFASTPIATCRGYGLDAELVNFSGSGCSLGHPISVHNASSPAELGRRLRDLCREAGLNIPNLVVHQTNSRPEADLALITEYPVPAVTS